MNRLTNVVCMVIVFLGPTIGVVDSVHAAIPTIERQVLIALYESTDGDHWINKSGWKEGDLAKDGFALPGTEEKWHGITCSDDNDRVTKITLDSNRLIGRIPAALGSLVNLQGLELQTNQLSGSIPPELGNLVNLEYLYLYSNQLSGSIPAALGTLVKLQALYLHFNQLSGSIPAALENLAGLLYLRLESNQLSGTIPPELGNVVTLVELHLDSNQLNGTIPRELGNLANLETLDLGWNQLSGAIPTELMNLYQLWGLNICNNHLYIDDSDPLAPALLAFLNDFQAGWESCQTPLPVCLPSMYLLLLGD